MRHLKKRRPQLLTICEIDEDHSLVCKLLTCLLVVPIGEGILMIIGLDLYFIFRIKVILFLSNFYLQYCYS